MNGQSQSLECAAVSASAPTHVGAVAQRLRRRRIRVEVEVPEGLMGEFDLMVHELLAGKRARLDTLEQEFKAIETRALAGLAVIVAAISAHGGTGQSGRLVGQKDVAASHEAMSPRSTVDLIVHTKTSSCCVEQPPCGEIHDESHSPDQANLSVLLTEIRGQAGVGNLFPPELQSFSEQFCRGLE